MTIVTACMLALGVAAILQALSAARAASDQAVGLMAPARAPMDQLRGLPEGVSAANPDDAYWDSQFTAPGPDNFVAAIVVSGTDVYAGGGFTSAENVLARGIARWNRVSSTWSPVGGSVGGQVYALAISGTDIYAGGSFTLAGNLNVNYIAKWDGSQWSALGSGLDGSVSAIAISGTDLYAGGSFSNAGGSSATGIARWDGSNWNAVGTGANAAVYAIAISGTNIFATGSFTAAGGTSANRFAVWDGSSWSALGGGVPDRGRSIAIKGAEIYVADDWPGGVQRWNGSSWSKILNGGARRVVVKGSQVIVGGFLLCPSLSCAGNGYNLLRWDGFNWFPYAVSDFTGGKVPLFADGNDLYVGGYFSRAGNVFAANIAIYNDPGTGWSALGTLPFKGVENWVRAIEVSGAVAYVGGGTFPLGGNEVPSIAKWDGSQWSAVGDAIYGEVRTIAFSGTTVYIGGDFDSSGGNGPNRIARLTGSTWTSVGGGVDSGVRAVVVSQTDLYVGGYFITAGAGITVNRVARWDGSNWSALGSGTNGKVYSLAISGTEIYAGGSFTMAGGIAANHIARWDGSAWSPLGSGLNGTVVALAASGGRIYAGGYYTMAGGSAISYIAQWDGSTWSALGSGLSGDPGSSCVCRIVPAGGDLYVGGHFDTAGGTWVNNIARWDGNNWHALGSGMSGTSLEGVDVSAMAVQGSSVFIGGQFSIAGDKPSINFARWFKPGLSPVIYLPLTIR